MTEKVLLYELEEELIDYRWNQLLEYATPGHLIEALLRYLIDSDSYMLSELFDMHFDNSDKIWFAFSDWADDAYSLWESRVSALRCEYYGMLHNVLYSPSTNNYILHFKE